MPGLIPTEDAVLLPLLALGLLIMVCLFGGLLVHLWVAVWRGFADFWHAVGLCIYLGFGWRVAWDRARRRVFS